MPARVYLAGVGKWVPGRVEWAQGEVVARPVSVDHSRGRSRGELLQEFEYLALGCFLSLVAIGARYGAHAAAYGSPPVGRARLRV